jgi:hypothetical protein
MYSIDNPNPMVRVEGKHVIYTCHGTLDEALSQDKPLTFCATALDVAKEHKCHAIIFEEASGSGRTAYLVTHQVVNRLSKRNILTYEVLSATRPLLKTGLPRSLKKPFSPGAYSRPTLRNQILLKLSSAALSDAALAKSLMVPVDTVSPVRGRLLKAGLIEDSGEREIDRYRKTKRIRWRVKQ